MWYHCYRKGDLTLNIIVCIDENMGMAFNCRRQSKDSAVRKRIAKITAGKLLRMNEYSARQFRNNTELALCVEEDFLDNACEEDFCFVETASLSAYADRIKTLTVYKWNRSYPSDLKLDIKLSACTLVSSAEFKGSSHDRITEEVYTNVK